MIEISNLPAKYLDYAIVSWEMSCEPVVDSDNPLHPMFIAHKSGPFIDMEVVIRHKVTEEKVGFSLTKCRASGEVRINSIINYDD